MIKALLIDDESNCTDTLVKLLEVYCPQIQVLASCNDSREASILLKNLKPDLVFLDVEMPYMDGFDVLEQQAEINFGLIFTTAYDHYALKAIKFSALDYLLKPINDEELQAAVLKFEKNQSNSIADTKTQVKYLLSKQNQPFEKLTIPTMNGLIFVEINDIIRCVSEVNYTRFYLQNGEQILSSYTLKEYESMLSSHNFFRIHQSDLINLAHLKSYTKGEGGHVVMSDGCEVQVSRRRKEEFLKRV